MKIKTKFRFKHCRYRNTRVFLLNISVMCFHFNLRLPLRNITSDDTMTMLALLNCIHIFPSRHANVYVQNLLCYDEGIYSTAHGGVPWNTRQVFLLIYFLSSWWNQLVIVSKKKCEWKEPAECIAYDTSRIQVSLF